MFSPNHEIWKFADAGGELDDWLPYAEDLARQWASQRPEEIKFRDTFQVILAALMSMDGLLPVSAQQAFARLTLDVVNEASEKRLTLSCLGIRPPPPGRKEDKATRGYRLMSVSKLIREGVRPSQAYEIVAKNSFKSVDTIRREYERAIRTKRGKKQTGEINE